MICVHFQGKPFNIIVIQVYAPTSRAEEAEVEWFYEDLQDLLELTPKKDVLYITGKTGYVDIPSGNLQKKLFLTVRAFTLKKTRELLIRKRRE